MKCDEHFLAEFLARPVIEEPYPFYARLQEHSSITYVAPHDLWLVSGYRDCLAVLQNASAFEQWNGSELFACPSRRRQIQKDAQDHTQWKQSTFSNANAAHSCLRSSNATDPVLPAYTPPQLLVYRALSTGQHSAGIESGIRQQAQELVNNFIFASTIEAVNRFALPLSMMALGDLFGLAWDEWAGYFLERMRPIRPSIWLRRELIVHTTDKPSQAKFHDHLAKALQKRLQDPCDDVLTSIAHTAFRERSIDETAIVGVIENVSVNAVLTTADLIGNAIWLILREPDVHQQIAANLALLPGAVHEALRVASPVQGQFYRATKATDLPTSHVPAGARLLLLFAAANRDASQFPRPDRFDILRANVQSHLGFGYGAHACIGRPLALLITRIAIETMLTRFPRIRLIEDQPLSHHPNKLNRGLRALYLQINR